MYPYYTKRNEQVSNLEKLVGRGMQYSPMVVNNKHVSNTGVDRISQSLFCIFSTRRGERLFQPEFGTKIYEYLFEPNDYILKDLIKYYAEQEIKQWENRIVADVDVVLKEGTPVIELRIIYSIIGDKDKYTFVFPFSREVSSIGGETYE